MRRVRRRPSRSPLLDPPLRAIALRGARLTLAAMLRRPRSLRVARAAQLLTLSAVGFPLVVRLATRAPRAASLVIDASSRSIPMRCIAAAALRLAILSPLSYLVRRLLRAFARAGLALAEWLGHRRPVSLRGLA